MFLDVVDHNHHHHYQESVIEIGDTERKCYIDDDDDDDAEVVSVWGVQGPDKKLRESDVENKDTELSIK